MNFYRVLYGAPLHHLVVMVMYYSAVSCHVAIMINLSCHALLKFSYFLCFDIINNIFDETLLLWMRITSLSGAVLSVASEIFWKVNKNI